MKNRFIIIIHLLIMVVIASPNIYSQQEISLNDVVPPYKFTARLLSNGHFYITTKYIGDTSKPIIYFEQESDIRPVNYTSHIHFRINGKIFQLPFEQNPATQLPPPENTLIVQRLFRDTLNRVPRINASLLAVMPGDNDSLKFTFIMEPIKRSGGGFIRMTARIDTSSRQHQIGVMLLVDTKIGNNDRAPIVTSFGYFDKEREFPNPSRAEIPEFWLALEGSPVAPGLTARGNLVAKDLIAPDYFMFGNWSDYTAQTTIQGLGSFLWKDRSAVDTLYYTDSAVLLVWDDENVPAGVKRLLASTEIGIVDSLEVVDAGGTGGGGGGGDGIFYARPGGSGSCLAFDTLHQQICFDPNYHPYIPDTLEAVFIITNTKSGNFSNVRIVADLNEPGLKITNLINPIIPQDLGPGETSVGVLSFYAEPRLYTKTFNIPLLMLGNINDTLAIDNICITVPGIIARDSIVDLDFRLLCPSVKETRTTKAFLKGIRCRDIDSLYIIGTPPGLNAFQVVNPYPRTIAANGFVELPISFQPPGLGDFSAKLVIEVKDEDGFTGGESVVLRDTCDLFGTGKEEEFFYADFNDTLKLGRVCVGDTAISEWPILNTGGCDVVISSYDVSIGKAGQFSIANAAEFPLTIPKEDIGEIGRTAIMFNPSQGGWDTAKVILRSISAPRADTLIVIGFGDLPSYIMSAPVAEFDTICPGTNLPFILEVINPTACTVDIDTCFMKSGLDIFIIRTPKFSLAPDGSVFLSIEPNLQSIGEYFDTLVVVSALAGTNEYPVHAIVHTRVLDVGSQILFGDVRVGKSAINSITINSIGSTGLQINDIRIGGVHSGDFALRLPPSLSLPIYIPAGDNLTFEVEFLPNDIENRQAFVIFDADAKLSCDRPDDLILRGRGIRPLIDIERNVISLGRVCVGKSIDSSVIIRNFGNGLMNISGIKQNGDTEFLFESAFPVQIDSNSSQAMKFNFTPLKLGEFEASIYFESDGDWIAQPDTLRLYGVGVLCCTLSIDTIYAQIGEIIDIPLKFRLDEGLNILPGQVAEILNASDINSTSVTITNNRKLFRFFDIPVTTGLLSGQALLEAFPDSINIESVSTNSLSRSDSIFAVLKGEALIGNELEAKLIININDFAGAYSDIKVRNGLVVPLACAIEKKLVTTENMNFIIPSEHPKRANSSFSLYLTNAEEIELEIYDIMGKLLINQQRNFTTKGRHDFTMPFEKLSSGHYLLKVRIGGDILTQTFIYLE